MRVLVEGSWAETVQYQQKSPQTRKQPKFQNNKNTNTKFYSKNHYSYNHNKSQLNTSSHQQTTVENNDMNNNSVVPDSIQYVKSTVDQYMGGIEYKKIETQSETSNSSMGSCERADKEQLKAENPYDQAFVPSPEVTEVQHAEVNGCYSNANYDYDYQQSNVQQQSQYYIYQPYQDYSQVPNMAGRDLELYHHFEIIISAFIRSFLWINFLSINIHK